MNLSRMYWRCHKNRAVMLVMTIVVSTMAMTMGTFMARSQSQTAVQEKLDETGEYDLVVPDISEKDLHDGFEYIIARHKKEIEENRYATTEQKEVEKNIRELILKSIEEQINVYLKSQNRLL